MRARREKTWKPAFLVMCMVSRENKATKRSLSTYSLRDPGRARQLSFGIDKDGGGAREEITPPLRWPGKSWHNWDLKPAGEWNLTIRKELWAAATVETPSLGFGSHLGAESSWLAAFSRFCLGLPPQKL